MRILILFIFLIPSAFANEFPDLKKSDALFVSFTALPVLSIISELEKKISKVVLSSNQTLIWDTLKQINIKYDITGYGQLFNN